MTGALTLKGLLGCVLQLTHLRGHAGDRIQRSYANMTYINSDCIKYAFYIVLDII